MWRLLMIGAVIVGSTLRTFADVESGPKDGEKLAECKVFSLLGPIENKEVDYTIERKGEPTIYLFVQAEKFDRPLFRFMKTLDAQLANADKTRAVAVWLSDDADASKAYIERARMSLSLDHTSITVFPGEKSGPKGWGLNPDAHLTVVVAKKGRVVKTFAYESVNETDVKAVMKALK